MAPLQYPAHQNGHKVVQNGTAIAQAYLKTGTMPGGDGTGTGSPGFNINNTVHAVNDLGLDSNGGSNINGTLQNVSSNTRVVFPPGNYRTSPYNNGTHIQNNDVLLEGLGSTRDEVSFFVPFDTAGDGFTFSGSNQGIVNATFDHSHDDRSIFGMNITGGGTKYFYNIQHIGQNRPSTELYGPLDGEGGGKKHCWGVGMGSSGHLHVENYKWTAYETDVHEYPDGLIGMQIPASNSGSVTMKNNWMEGRSEHTVYGSRTPAAIHIKGGLYQNNCNTNMRIEGSNSWIEDAVLRTNMSASRPDVDGGKGKACRLLWWENNKSTSSSGGHVRNCDFIIKNDYHSGASHAINAPWGEGGFTVENCRFLTDDDTNPCCVINVPNVVFEGCSWTGSSGEWAVNGNGDTVVRDSCNELSQGFTSCNTSNISTNGCTVAEGP